MEVQLVRTNPKQGRVHKILGLFNWHTDKQTVKEMYGRSSKEGTWNDTKASVYWVYKCHCMHIYFQGMPNSAWECKKALKKWPPKNPLFYLKYENPLNWPCFLLLLCIQMWTYCISVTCGSKTVARKQFLKVILKECNYQNIGRCLRKCYLRLEVKYNRLRFISYHLYLMYH